MGLNAYYEVRMCVPTAPASGGKFLKLGPYVWGCGYEKVENLFVYELVLHLGEVARCITNAACSGIYKLNPSN